MIKELLILSIFAVVLDYGAGESIEVDGIVQCCVAQSPTLARPRRGFIDSWLKNDNGFRIDKRNAPKSFMNFFDFGPSGSEFPGFASKSANVLDAPKAHYLEKCKPIVNAVLELWEEDGSLIDKDDFLNTTTTAKNGHFNIQGSETEIGSADFYVKLIHTCGMKVQDVKSGCKRISTRKVDRKYNGKDWKMSYWHIFAGTSGDSDKTVC